MIPKFSHDCLHGAFIFFEKSTQLLVLLQQGLVFNDDLCIQTFNL
jgi:hypothetical protein